MSFFSDFEGYKKPEPLGVILPTIEVDKKTLKKMGLDPDKEYSSLEILKKLSRNGIKERGYDKKPNKKEYYDRALTEIKVFDELGFVDYVLLNWQVINNAKEKGIVVGRGRGSCAGSLILDVLNVTEVDPIEHELFFERFVSKSRAKKIIDEETGEIFLEGSLLPDVDSDYDFLRRSEVLDYINNQYKGRTAKILTMNTFAPKLVWKEALKYFHELNEEEASFLSGKVSENHGIALSLQASVEDSEDFKGYTEEYPEAFEAALKIQNLNKNFGVHPSGIAISNVAINELVPLQKTKDGEIVTGYDMNDVSDLCVKFDVLGLKTLSIVDLTCKQLGIELKDINPSDDSIYAFLQDFKHPCGLFQISAETNFKVAQGVKPVNLAEISDVVALARPGALDFVGEYIKVKNGEKTIEEREPELDKILSKTKNTILYQEQLMHIANKVFGLTLDDAESLRRCVTGDTRFFSKTRGWIKLETLIETGYKNELFLVLDQFGKKTWKNIQNIWSNGIKQIRYVELSNGMTTKSSRYHQYLTDNGWKSRMRLSDQDFIATVSESGVYCKNTISKSLCIILAGMMTEGYFVLGNQPKFTNYDECIYNEFYNSCVEEFGEENISKSKCGKVISLKKKAADKLLIYMKRGKSANKTIPEIIFSQGVENLKSFVSFAFACEGTFCDRELSLTSKSRGLINKLQLILNQFGILTFTNIKKNKQYGDYWNLYISPTKNGEHLKKFLDLFSESLQGYKIDKLNFYINNNTSEGQYGYSHDSVPMSIVDKFMDQYPYVPHQLNFNSGRMFSGEERCNTLRSKTFYKMCEHSKDPLWEQFSEGNVLYSKVKDLNKDIREVEVFDFTVDDETPFIVANGMVIHNCVGKKKVDEMPKWEKIIFDAAEKKGLNESISKFYWKALSDSANYSFNLSHAISYAMLAAQTVWLKANHPKEFFLSCLKMAKDNPDPLLEVSKIYSELLDFGISLKKPDLKKSHMDFSIEDSAIRYGLSTIKGVSNNTIPLLQDFIVNRKEESNKYDIFSAFKDSKISIGVLSSLIQAGTLSEDTDSVSRSRLVLEAQTWNVLTDREKRELYEYGKEYNFDLLQCIADALSNKIKDSSGKEIFQRTRPKTFKKKFDKYRELYLENKKHEMLSNWWFENSLLGYSFSCDLVNCLEGYGEILMIDDFEKKEQSSYKHKEEYHVCGKVIDVIKRKSKKGNQYLKLTINDGKSTTGAIMVDSEKNKKLTEYLEDGGVIPKEDDLVVCSGQKGEDIMFCENIFIIPTKIYMKISQLKD